ncbi:hypothetical protein [Kistimonas scapharcae]
MQTTPTFSQQQLFPAIFGDYLFVYFIPLIAITCGFYAYFVPERFEWILIADLWLLGYHHVISTFTRIGFDKKSAREHWFFLVPLPLMIITVVCLIYSFTNAALIGSVYLYWQWYHYSRQSEGVAKSYGMKGQCKVFATNSGQRIAFYLVPLTTFVYMISAGHSHFLGIPIWTIIFPDSVRLALLAICFGAIIYWMINGTRALLRKEITPFYFGYVLTHFVIYTVSYVVINDINCSWLTINIWHNAQYIGFVWLFNRKRYAAGIEKDHHAISFLSQPGRLLIYLGTCLTLSTVVYFNLETIVTATTLSTGLPLALLIYATINFHHYIVDSQIWKLRKPSIQKNLLETQG